MPYADSSPVDADLALQGVWLHDPLDAEGTVEHYPYGPAKTSSIITTQAGIMYAGRTYPVVDFGEHEEQPVSVIVHVPAGSTAQTDVAALEAWARARRTIWLRDGRGRSMPGTVSDFKTDDQRWGVVVTWTHSRSEYEIEEASV